MYRDQTLPGGGLTLLGVLALSLLAPGWAARAFGCATLHAHLVEWILAQSGLVLLILGALYVAIGFALLLGAVMGVYAAGVVLLKALAAIAGGAAQTSRAVAMAIGTLLTWPLRLLAECLWDACAPRVVRLNALLEEQQEMRRVYREDYAGDFPSYRAFLRDWRARQNTATERQSSDARAQAIRLMGLPESFTRGELKIRFRTLIERIHPDKVGPNELATQLIAAYTLLNQGKDRT
jgi:hypothetical protein